MKKIILTLLAFTGFASLSQIETVQLNYSYDITSVYPEDSSVTQSVDVDQDGTVDFKINSWFGHNSGSFGAVELAMTNSLHTDGFVTNQCQYLKTCGESGIYFNSASGYIYNTEQSSCIFIEGQMLFPFSFLSNDGIHYSVLQVEFYENSIAIVSVSWNSQANQNYDCSYTLGLNEFESENQAFNYFNMLGQEVQEKKGVLLEVSKSGQTKRVYFE